MLDALKSFARSWLDPSDRYDQLIGRWKKGEEIAAAFPTITCQEATLSKTKRPETPFCLTLVPSSEELPCYFSSEGLLLQWLAQQKGVAMWEIEDQIQNKQRFFRRSTKSWTGLEEVSEEERFNDFIDHLNKKLKRTPNDYSFRIISPDKETTAIYRITAQSKKIRSFSLEELSDYENSGKTEEEKRSTLFEESSPVSSGQEQKALILPLGSRRWKNLALGVGLLAAGYQLWSSQDSSTLFTALSVFMLAKSRGLPMAQAVTLTGASVFFTQWPSSDANQSPEISQPLSPISIYPDQMIELEDIGKIFADMDGDSLGYTIDEKPDFLNATFTPLISLGSFNATATPPLHSLFLDGSLLHIMSTNGPYEIWNVTDFSNAEKAQTYLGEIKSVLQPAFFDEKTVVSTTQQKFQILDASQNPMTELGNITGSPIVGVSSLFLYEQGREIVWFNPPSEPLLQAVSVANLIFPTILGQTAQDFSSLSLGPFPYLFGCSGNSFLTVNTQDASMPTVVKTTATLDGCTQTYPGGIGLNTLFVAERTGGLSEWDITNPVNPLFKSRRENGGPYLVFRLQVSGSFLAYSDPTNPYPVKLYEITNSSQTQPYTEIPVDEAIGGLLFQNNLLITGSSTGRMSKYAINRLDVRGLPGVSDRGEHTLRISAHDGKGGNAEFNLPIHVLNRNPTLLEAIPRQTAEANRLFDFRPLPDQYAIDPDGDSLSILSPTSGRPSWLLFDGAENRFYGIPGTADVANSTVFLSFVDPFNGAINTSFALEVTPGLSQMPDSSQSATLSQLVSPLSSSGSSETLLVPLLIASGGVICIVGIGVAAGGLIFYLKEKDSRRADLPIEMGSLPKPREDIKSYYEEGHEVLNPQSTLSFELSADEIATTRVFGERNYAFVDFSRDSMKEKLLRDTNIAMRRKDGWIAKGNDGNVYIVWSFLHQTWVAAKQITEEDRFAISTEEANIQREASEDGKNEGIWPIYNTIKDRTQGELIHLMPLAEYGNLLSFVGRLEAKGLLDQSTRELLAAEVAFYALKGCQAMHSKGIIHADIKDENFLVGNRKGGIRIGLSDFGRSFKMAKPSKPHENVVSDFRYQPPERLFARKSKIGQFFGIPSDYWGVGCVLLSIMVSEDIFKVFAFDENLSSFLDRFKTLEEIQHHFQEKLDGIPQIKNPPRHSIWEVIRGLLTIDETRRWKADFTLLHSSFQNRSNEKLSRLIEQLASPIEEKETSVELETKEASSRRYGKNSTHSFSPDNEIDPPRSIAISPEDRKRYGKVETKQEEESDKKYNEYRPVKKVYGQYFYQKVSKHEKDPHEEGRKTEKKEQSEFYNNS